MSYHRVLPPPPALANQNCANSWVTERDAILQPKTMTTENPRTYSTRSKSPTLSDRSSSPIEDRVPVSPGADILEVYEDTPKARTRSTSQVSKGESQGSGKRLPSISGGSGIAWQGESPSQICLCQPDPKVPRPRNAFILYRQHHQAGVVSQNPGLANPEISKVIGDHWRSSSPEIKHHWKILAEEEKLRHQRQYPDYRYQPRRSGRNNSLTSPHPSASSTDSPASRCVKCGGRSMNTPGMLSSSTLSMPSTASTHPYSPSLPPPTPSTGGSSTSRLLHNPPSQTPTSAFRPQSATATTPQFNALQLNSPRCKRSSDAQPSSFPQSPDSKRRRLLTNTAYIPVRVPAGPATPFSFARGVAGAARRESLPRPDFMPSQSATAFAMGPPPRPLHSHNPNHQRNSSNSSKNPSSSSSLTLPPIKTASSAPDSPASSYAKSVEAMVMSIPPLNKIRLLAKISPPLAAPSPSSPSYPTRGLVIAVEGANAEGVEQLVTSLKGALEEAGNCRVKVFEGVAGEDKDERKSSLRGYLKMVEGYHAMNEEVVKYITTVPDEHPPPSSPSSLDSMDVDAVSPKTVLVTTTSSHTPSPPSQPPPSQAAGKPPPPPSSLPIALLPTYQLTHTDAAASAIPITDAYAPVDHWQWMASLWRGIVGADVTVALLRDVAGEREGGPKQDALQMGAPQQGKGEVEVRLEDARAVAVRAGPGGRVREGALRRVGFEVGEWVRGRGGRG